MTNVVKFTRALADPTRWRIVRLVMREALRLSERQGSSSPGPKTLSARKRANP